MLRASAVVVCLNALSAQSRRLSGRLPVTRRTICDLILRAAVRAGMESTITGTRILRHTAATRMLRHGASIKEIADVLRHKCLDTTTIYTKVDLARLATVALPWPVKEDR